ncbi:MAG: hypothetical protein OFPII_09700 [Osedax symbiont Rs1]|nr:MAG: hypothetical protein OFPII_09700 [Osedax symbiont Rs1]
MSISSNIAIVGAGLVGRLLAYRLAKLNYKVSLYEANSLTTNKTASQLTAAAFTAAGMIAPISEALEADLNTYYLGKTSLALWPDIIRQLSLNGESVDYRQLGSLIISHPQDIAELTHFERRVKQLAEQCAAKYQILDTAQIKQLEPNLGNGFAAGLLLEEEAHIDNRQLMSALLNQCLSLGVAVFDNSVVSIKNNRVISPWQTQSYDWVFDCRGLGAKEQLPKLRGVRGEVLRIHCPEISISRPVRLMHPRYQLYLVPKPNQEFVIGATQIESEDTSAVSVQSMLELCSAMYSINPAFAEARIIEQNTNLRPALPDNNPQVLVSGQHISINGLFRHGYLVAPAIIESVICWLQGDQCRHYPSLFAFQEPNSV